jgi:hypothetical protein
MKKQGNLLSNFTAAPAQAQSSNGRARAGMPKLRAGRNTLQYRPQNHPSARKNRSDKKSFCESGSQCTARRVSGKA